MSLWQNGIKLIEVIRNSLYPMRSFRDASKGTLLERAAAYRHNREARGSLPQYMTNWVFVGVLLFGAGVWLESVHNLPAAVLCWLLMTYAATELAVLSAIFLILSACEF